MFCWHIVFQPPVFYFVLLNQINSLAAQVDVLKATIALIVTIALRNKPCIEGPNCKLRHGWGFPSRQDWRPWSKEFGSQSSCSESTNRWMNIFDLYISRAVEISLPGTLACGRRGKKTRRHHYERAVPVKRFWLWKKSSQPIQHGKAQSSRMQQNSQLVRWPEGRLSLSRATKGHSGQPRRYDNCMILMVRN